MLPQMTAGLGSSKETNEGLNRYREMGERGGMFVICDRKLAMPIDSDHPLGRKEVSTSWDGPEVL